MSKEERAILLLNIYKEENSRLRRETLDRKIEIARQTADKEITPEESDLKIMEIEAGIQMLGGGDFDNLFPFRIKMILFKLISYSLNSKKAIN